MIDDLEKSMALVEIMRAALPLRAFATRRMRRTLQQDSNRGFPCECGVTEVSYTGDEGGIVCHLDFGFDDTEAVHIVSITHLGFDRVPPLRLRRQKKGYAPFFVQYLSGR